ncbi:hypothetical protein LTR28_000016 [Elasticomyces elasticus]|nr:hypothetical protein LTR28_000016 [Elasticomyces elasticus]
MYTALCQLGYTPYHMIVAMENPIRSLGIGNEAVDAHYYDKGAQFTRRDFDAWLGDFDAVLDVPCCLLADELTAAYPDAKVILTSRDPDGWVRSCRDTVVAVMGWRSWSVLKLIDLDVFHFVNAQDKWADITDGWTKPGLLRHEDHVRAVVPKENLLEFQAGRDGWKELSAFLGMEAPEGDFPRVNEAESGFFTAAGRQVWNQAIMRVLMMAAFWFLFAAIEQALLHPCSVPMNTNNTIHQQIIFRAHAFYCCFQQTCVMFGFIFCAAKHEE